MMIQLIKIEFIPVKGLELKEIMIKMINKLKGLSLWLFIDLILQVES